MFTSILCAVDFSEGAERALGHAVRLAKLTGAHLTIVTAIDPLLAAASEAAGQRDVLSSQTQQELQQLLHRVSDDLDTLVPAIAIVVGDAPKAILAHAAEIGAELIVMGTQGLGAAKRLVFGSTAEQVLRGARIPVLAVPNPHRS